MLEFNEFYNAVKNKKLSILRKIVFRKNILDTSLKNFLLELLHYIIEFIWQVEVKLPTFKEVNKNFVDNLEFFNKFYLFLKANKDKFKTKIDELKMREHGIEFVTAIEQIDSENHKKCYGVAFTVFSPTLEMLDNDVTMFLNVNLAQAYESCMKILSLILYANNSQCSEEELGDILFEIYMELYEHMILHRFEDIDTDKEGIGLIHQIEWLKQNVELVKKAQQHPTPYFN